MAHNACAAFACVAVVLCGCSGRLSESNSVHGGGADGGWDEGAAIVSSTAKCGATPRQVVDFHVLAKETNSEGIAGVQLAVDATNAYFAFGGSLWRLPLQGGSPAAILVASATGVGQNSDPTVTSTRVVLHYLVPSGGNEQIVSVPIAGGQGTTLATTDGRVDALTANDTAVYFADQSGIHSVPVAGGTAQLLTDEVAQATGLAVVGANLIATVGAPINFTGMVVSVPVGGGSPTTLATRQPNPSFPLKCGTDVCWYTGAPPSAMGPTGPAYIARLANGQVSTIPAQVYPWSLTFDGSDFFETVGCDLCPGTLMRIPSSGATATTMVTATFVAVDDQCAYFSVADGFDLPSPEGGIGANGIYSVAKSYADPQLQTGM